MKRKLLALLIIPVILCGCNGSVADNAESHAQITVNYPSDDTVNGYRPGGSGSMPDEIPADSTVPAKPQAQRNRAYGVHRKFKFQKIPHAGLLVCQKAEG